MKKTLFDFSTIFGGKVGFEYLNLRGIDDDGLEGALVIDLLFVRLTVCWGTVSE